MAAVTSGVSSGNTADNSALTTGAFTPAASDLLIGVASVTGQAGGGTFTDSQTLGWTQISTSLKNTSADTLVFAVSNALAANSSMTVTFTPAGAPTATGVRINVIRVSGITRTGSAAIRQSATKEQNQSTGGTPAPPFPVAALTGNPCIGAVFNGTNPATMTAPSGWTELVDAGIGTPAHGLETVAINSGFTGTTITWGSTSPSAFCDYAIEVDTSAPSSPGWWNSARPMMGALGSAA